LGNGRLGLAVADVSDKGVPAALFMMSSRTLLKGAVVGMGTPGAVLSEVNDLLNENNETFMFVTLIYAVFDPLSGLLTYANGGHCNPLLVHADGTSEELPLTGGIALGVMPKLEYSESSTTLEPGDTLVLYTDGVSEAMNSDGEEFGVDRLRKIFVDHSSSSAREANEAVLQAVNDFAGGHPQSDDVTCLVLRRPGG
jgi:sigma-B regulation protein RsbU (phosphoserine phosphatase)